MSCDGYQDQVELLLMKRLAPADEDALQAHLRACPGCREYLKAQKRLHTLLGLYTDRPAPTAVRARLYRKLERPEPARLVFGLRRWVLAGAFAGVVTAILILVARPTPTPPPPPVSPQVVTATADDVASEFFVNTEEPTKVMATLANYTGAEAGSAAESSGE